VSLPHADPIILAYCNISFKVSEEQLLYGYFCIVDATVADLTTCKQKSKSRWTENRSIKKIVHSWYSKPSTLSSPFSGTDIDVMNSSAFQSTSWAEREDCSANEGDGSPGNCDGFKFDSNLHYSSSCQLGDCAESWGLHNAEVDMHGRRCWRK
jgi:hypothetical protein